MKRGVNKFVFVGIVNSNPYKLEEGKLQRYEFGIRIPEHLGDDDFYEFFNVIVWGDLGEYAYKNIKEGCKLYIEGRIRTRVYGKRVVQEFHASKLNVLGE